MCEACGKLVEKQHFTKHEAVTPHTPGTIEQSTKAGGAIEQSAGELWSTIPDSGASERLAAVQEAAGACEEPTDMESLGSDIPAGFVIVNSRTLYDVSHRHTHTGHRDVRGRVCQVM
jgi:hypothetical protein